VLILGSVRVLERGQAGALHGVIRLEDVARGTLDGGVELEPGRDYFISATLPDGSRVSTHAKLDANATEVVLPRPAAAFVSRVADQPQPAASSDLEAAAAPPLAIRGAPNAASLTRFARSGAKGAKSAAP
jgi:hypothetical protein